MPGPHLAAPPPPLFHRIVAPPPYPSPLPPTVKRHRSQPAQNFLLAPPLSSQGACREHPPPPPSPLVRASRSEPHQHRWNRSRRRHLIRPVPVSRASKLSPVVWAPPSAFPWFTGAAGPLAHRRRPLERLHCLESHRRAFSSAPHHRRAARVSPRHCLLVRRTTLASLVLVLPLPPHLVRWRARVDGAERGDHAGERIAPTGPTVFPGPLGQAGPKKCIPALYTQFSILFYIFRKSNEF
jgi:hypothetical protein